MRLNEWKTFCVDRYRRDVRVVRVVGLKRLGKVSGCDEPEVIFDRQNLTPSFNPDDSMGEYVDDEDDDLGQSGVQDQQDGNDEGIICLLPK